jgi:hypothetical protein
MKLPLESLAITFATNIYICKQNLSTASERDVANINVTEIIIKQTKKLFSNVGPTIMSKQRS